MHALFYDHSITRDGKIFDPDGRVLPQNNFNGYAGVWIGKRNYYVHRLLAHVFVPNPAPKLLHLVDHIDRDKKNNAISNLRWVNHAINGLNTDAKNAYYVKKWKKWQARVCGKSLGYYKTFEKAHEVSKAYRLKLLETIYNQTCAKTDDSYSNSFEETRRYPTLVS